MIIRSQNRKEIHNLEKISMIKVVTNSQEFMVEVNSQHVIGTYSTEEKATKVLDMIQQKFCDYGKNGVFNMPSNDVMIEYNTIIKKETEYTLK